MATDTERGTSTAEGNRATRVPISVSVDGTTYSDDVEPRLLFVHYLREVLGLTGTNVGCDTSNCGACTVLVAGQSVKSCTMLAAQADGAEVTTVQGLAATSSALGGTDAFTAVQKAFHEQHGLQCGFCTPGMICAATSLLSENPSPTEEEIRVGLEGNLCRCTGYQNIVAAVAQAAGTSRASGADTSRASGATDLQGART
ncbi:MAG TPA: (2Fe-2S)-binding protein [Euzebya sp.]|nr:(2Fe-2S)-binding protein [Euzebya sp.]